METKPHPLDRGRGLDWTRYEKGKRIIQDLESDEKKRTRNVLTLLRQRLETQIVHVKFNRPDGDFIIDCRIPSPAYKKRYLQAKAEVRSIMSDLPITDEGYKKLQILNDIHCEYLEWLCVDPLLNKEFWMKGEHFGADVPTRIFEVAMGWDTVEVDTAQFFRSIEQGVFPRIIDDLDRDNPESVVQP